LNFNFETAIGVRDTLREYLANVTGYRLSGMYLKSLVVEGSEDGEV
jgi:hypothetical protein